jgi:hypothetical protein
VRTCGGDARPDCADVGAAGTAPASEGVGPRIRILLAPAGSQLRT